MTHHRPARNAVLALMALGLVLASASHALTPEQATQVGGDLTVVAKKLAALQEAGSKVIEAAPGAGAELSAALGRIREARGRRDAAGNAWAGFLSILALWAAVLAFRRGTARARERCLRDSLKARGAAGLLGLEIASWAVLAAGAYLLAEFCFDAGGHQELLGVAVLWAIVRLRLFVVLIEAILRPQLPAFRLITMGDATAHEVKAVLTTAILAGLAGISVMPVLLRAGLPIPAGQVIVLLQGTLVAAGSALALWRYRASNSAPPRASRIWFAIGLVAIPLLWASWTVGVLLLEFAVYHSLVWSLRIAAFAYVANQLLGLSEEAPWVAFLRRSITAAAVLAIAILLAETWLVDQLGLVPAAGWVPVRRSLVTASITLFVGYVAWRYLHHWTEARLRAAAPGLMPGADADDDEENATPASRLTTVLPMLRILAGIAIIVVVALLALSQLGVEITPLLAGAGVFGLAISFGSQALVRDIVSGIFFMADDAFRVGEYIDTGRLKGTVERISLRSVRLRHQNGQVHTIPYGQLTSISNFSRDWQTVKFNLRIARGADIEKVRKTVKQIGLEMLADPELGKEFLLPLKLQGVAEITDNALVVRLKFTVKPAKPSIVQRAALKRIHRVFGEKGIEFPSSTITVQAAGGTLAPSDLAAAGAAGATTFPTQMQGTP